MRPGEKIYEELLADNENTEKTHHEKIMIAKVNTDNLDWRKEKIEHLCAQVSSRGSNHDPMVLMELVKQIVPEYVSQNSVFSQLDSLRNMKF